MLIFLIGSVENKKIFYDELKKEEFTLGVGRTLYFYKDDHVSQYAAIKIDNEIITIFDLNEEDIFLLPTTYAFFRAHGLIFSPYITKEYLTLVNRLLNQGKKIAEFSPGESAICAIRKIMYPGEDFSCKPKPIKSKVSLSEIFSTKKPLENMVSENKPKIKNNIFAKLHDLFLFRGVKNANKVATGQGYISRNSIK